MAFNLERQLLFYGQYHHDPVNVGIHITCVPPILLTGLMLATNAPDINVPSLISIPNLPVNLGTIGALGYSVGFILLEPVAGALISPVIMGSTIYGSYLTSTYGMTANWWLIGTQVICWVAQFIGHGAFEGRAPALLDNLVQALFLAPLFVWLEILFFFGYRPELKARLDKSVEQELTKLKQSERQRKVNGSANGSAK
ncbi:MAG: hypothetical protein M1820_002510 [Bogoriella megaspora]|nr:MAG: hypothetical protein M1820_002510 [Bogoriella megaspora]